MSQGARKRHLYGDYNCTSLCNMCYYLILKCYFKNKSVVYTKKVKKKSGPKNNKKTRIYYHLIQASVEPYESASLTVSVSGRLEGIRVLGVSEKLE